MVMKNSNFLIIFLVVMGLLVGSASAKNYYVDPSSSGNGLSVNTPCNPTTIDDIATAGDTIYFLDGVYSGIKVTIQNSGNYSNPIILKAYNGTPTLDGLNKTGSGIIITTDYVVIDGLNIIRYNRGINVSNGNHITILNNSITNNYDGIYLSCSDGATIKNNTIKGNLLLEDTQNFESGMGNWVGKTQNGNASNTVQNAINIVTSKPFTGTHSLAFTTKGDWGVGYMPQAWIQKHYSISSPCDYQVSIESYFQSDKPPIPGNTVTNLEGKISVTNITGINLDYPLPIMGYFEKQWQRGVWWQSFPSSTTSFYASEGLYTSYGWDGYIDDIVVTAFGKDTHNGITIINSSTPNIQRNTIKYMANDGVYLDRCVSPTIDNCIIEYSINYGVYTTESSSYISLHNSSIFKCGLVGASVWSSNFSAINNTVKYTRNYGIQSDGNNTVAPTNITAKSNTIVLCHMYTDVPSAGISIGTNSIAANNTISYGIQGLKANSGSTISNNSFHNISGNCIDLEYRQYNLTVENNTFDSYNVIPTAVGLRLKMIYNSVIKHNIFTNIGNAISLQAYNSINSEKNTFQDNIIIGGGTGFVAEDICDNTIKNNTFINQTKNAIELQGSIETWSSFRNGITNGGLTNEYVLPSPFGVVPEILATGYRTPGLTTLWTSNLSTSIKSTPTTYDNILYVVTNGRLYAINNNDGSEIWNYSTGNVYPATISGIGNVLIHSSPTIANNVIYFGSGTTLYAVNTSGSLIWNYPTDGQVISSPQISGGNVYFGSTDGRFYAITTATGALNWSYDLNDPIVSTPCVVPSVSGSHAGITAKGYNGAVAEVLDDGSELWKTMLPKIGGWSSPVYSTNLYVCTNTNETGKSTIYAYNIGSGLELWKQDNIQGNITATPTVNAGGVGHLNVITENRAAYLLKLTGGTAYYTNITYGSSGYIASPLGFSPGYITVDSQGNIIRDYQFYTNSNINYYWHGSVPTNVSSSPIHSYGKLFVCGENGVIYALVPTSNVTISGNSISNVPVGICSYSTEAKVHNNMFKNVPQYLDYTQMFAVIGTIENNTLIGSSEITIDKNSYVLAKNTNAHNISFIDSGSKFTIENNDVRLTTQLNKAGKVNRLITNSAWNRSYASWNDTGTDSIAKYTLIGLKTGTLYSIKRNGVELFLSRPDLTGKIQFTNVGGSKNTFTVEENDIIEPDSQVPIAEFRPENNSFNKNISESTTFSVNSSQLLDKKWYINGTLSQNNSSFLTKSWNTAGTYNVTFIGYTGKETISHTWTVNIVNPPQPKDNSTFSISPEYQIVSPKKYFTLSINIDPGTPIKDAKSDLLFQNSLVKVNKISEGCLFNQDGDKTYFNTGIIDNNAGVVKNIYGSVVNSSVSSPGKLAVINLTAGNGTGVAKFNLSNVGISDFDTSSLPYITKNASVLIDTAPVLGSIGPKSINVTKKLSFRIKASDADGNKLNFSVIDLPTNANFDPATGTFTWTPSKTQAGTYTVTFKVSDGYLEDTEQVKITVKQPNAAPVISSFQPANNSAFKKGQKIKIEVKASDANKQILKYTIKIDGKIYSTSRTYIWNTNVSKNGKHRIEAIVSDGIAKISKAHIINIKSK